MTLPAHGTNIVYSLTLTFAGALSPGAPYWIAGIYFNGSPRCDIPFPFSAVGPGNVVAPGGYLASKLGTPLNSQPLTRLSAGVTTYTVPINTLLCLAFLPATDGWYRIPYNGADLVGVGEDDFGHQNRTNIGRGHAGRPFYCKITGPAGIPHDAVLTSYTPTMTAVSAATVLDLTLTAHIHWAWGRYAAPGPGTYTIGIGLNTINALFNGLVLDISGTDTTVLTYERRIWLETYDELNGNSVKAYKGTSNTPPVSPVNGDAWGTLSAPTGAWANYPNSIAIYDGYAVGWIFITPRVGSYLYSTGATFAIWTGAAWVTALSTIVWTVSYEAAGVFWMAFSSFAPERASTGGKIEVTVS